MANYGRLLLSMEIRSAQKYWHMPSGSEIYPESFEKNKMVGMIWDTKAGNETWNGADPCFIHGINMVPFTPITEDVFSDTYFVNEDWS